MIDADEVSQAIEIAAGFRLAGGGMSERQSASARAITATKRVISRFLENLPDDAMVVEVREAMQRGSADDNEEDWSDD